LMPEAGGFCHQTPLPKQRPAFKVSMPPLPGIKAKPHQNIVTQ